MDTLRVNIAYRPLRVCWAIKEGDFAAFREAVRTNYALWGGHFNPIVVVDQTSEAQAIVENFHTDVIIPIGDSDEVSAFSRRFSHLNSPLMHKGVFVGNGSDARTQILDVQNVINNRLETPEWNRLIEAKPHLYSWDTKDPLADILMMQLGQYPSVESSGTDYTSLFKETLNAEEIKIDGDLLLAEYFDFPTISHLSRHGITQHYSVQPNWSYPGFYVGDATNLTDLVTCWNLRACDISVLFVDRGQIARYKKLLPFWKKHSSTQLSQRRFREDYEYAIWERYEGVRDNQLLEQTRNLICSEPTIMRNVNGLTWASNNLVAPVMHFKEISSLGVIGEIKGKPRITFGLVDRPYASDVWFHNQHLVASVDFTGGLYDRDDFTLEPPCAPELNEFYSWTMHLHRTDIRIEPKRIGLIINAHEVDTFLYALPTNALFKAVFEQAGFEAKISSGGLLARQLIAQLGGLQGGRVFKIPGARQLLKTHGPTASFTKRSALQIIGKSDPENPSSNFKDHENLYLEFRESGTKLNVANVFSHMVTKGLFRFGADLLCPCCELHNWFPIDDVCLHVICQMCGHEFATTPQLIENELAFRRSGVLGTERNVQGAIPVALTLQQLDANLGSTGSRKAYSLSLDLKPMRGQLENPCEVDFVWMIPGKNDHRTQIIIGECKDRGHRTSGDGSTINATDIKNLRAVADSFPSNRYEVFILLAKLCSFTDEEILLAKSLNGLYQCRVILLTDRELEPYYLYDRTSKLFDVNSFSSTPTELAQATVNIFFNPKVPTVSA